MGEGELRRRDRAMEPSEAEAFLAGAEVGRLGTADARGRPYVTPFYFAYDRGAIYLHGTATGHVRSNLAANPEVCFEVDAHHGVIAGDQPCGYSAGFASAICFGTAAVVVDEGERQAALDLLMDKYGTPAPAGSREYANRGKTTIIGIAVRTLTGKRRKAAP